MAAIEAQTCDAYPELFHYTNWGGLSGMISNGAMWATRFDRLNDSTEVTHLREYMLRSLEPFALEKVKQYVKGSLKRKRLADKVGGNLQAAKINANATIDSAYKVSFLGGPGLIPHFVPYITSFCSHVADEEYHTENGLLSQWRAYGSPEGRFALVFDTKLLHERLSQESKLFAFSSLKFADVIYDNDDFDFASRFPDLIAELQRHHSSYYDGAAHELSNSKLCEEFLSATTRLKNRAFSEEREVRIIAIPLTQYQREQIFEEMGEDEAAGKSLIEIKHRQRDGIDVPYLSLFETSQKPLPIRRIIVGPCRDQASVFAETSRLVKGSVPVIRSKAPLVD